MILALLWKIIRFVEDQNRKKEEQLAQEKEVKNLIFIFSNIA